MESVKGTQVAFEMLEIFKAETVETYKVLS